MYKLLSTRFVLSRDAVDTRVDNGTAFSTIAFLIRFPVLSVADADHLEAGYSSSTNNSLPALRIWYYEAIQYYEGIQYPCEVQ